MQRSRKILFLADAGPLVGGGHVMRCLTLAGVLQDLGASCVFMAPPAVAAVVKTFAKPGVELIACTAETMVGRPAVCPVTRLWSITMVCNPATRCGFGPVGY